MSGWREVIVTVMNQVSKESSMLLWMFTMSMMEFQESQSSPGLGFIYGLGLRTRTLGGQSNRQSSLATRLHAKRKNQQYGIFWHGLCHEAGDFAVTRLRTLECAGSDRVMPMRFEWTVAFLGGNGNSAYGRKRQTVCQSRITSPCLKLWQQARPGLPTTAKTDTLDLGLSRRIWLHCHLLRRERVDILSLVLSFSAFFAFFVLFAMLISLLISHCITDAAARAMHRSSGRMRRSRPSQLTIDDAMLTTAV
jgi:hypothetical protein